MLRARGTRLTMLGSVALVVVSGGMAAVLKWPHANGWVLVATALAAMLVGVGSAWRDWRERVATNAGVVRRGVVGTQDSFGYRLPTVAEVDLAMLRVHRAVLDVPYVPRKLKEHEVTQLLLAQRPVLLVGSSMVGKTRLAAQVVKQLWAERSIVIPDTPSTLVDLDTHDLTIRDHVIWLDDLERFFTGTAVTAGLIRRLAERNHVIATLRAQEWDRFQPSNQLRPPEWDVLTVFEKVTLDREHDRPTDDDLRQAVPDSRARERIAQVGIGEYVGATQIIIDQLALGRASNPLGYALVLAAVDWRRIGITRPVPADLLPTLAGERLTPRERAELGDPASLNKALAWATRKINPTVALLEPGDDEYRVYDYALDRLTTADLIIPTSTWHIALDHATDDELLTIGYQAGVIHRLRDPADRAWRRAAAAGNVDAMYNLGVLLYQHGDCEQAQTWYQRAADTGHIHAMSNLAALLTSRGDCDKAETWCRRAADAGDNIAMSNLASLLTSRGDCDEAETWYRTAADAGHSTAMYRLGVLLSKHGDRNAAETWYRKAAEAGRTDAVAHLGPLLCERGDRDEALTWYQRVADAGNPHAVAYLSVLLHQHGDRDEAETYLRRAAEIGQVGAMYVFGVLLHERGDHDEAETWYRKAAEAGITVAIAPLGALLYERGDQDEAETYLRRAAEIGKVDAMHNLGVLLYQRGDRDEAETWYRKAAEAGCAVAMSNLGAVLAESGDRDEAERWCRKSADAGYAPAKSKLRTLLRERDDRDEAETGSIAEIDGNAPASGH